MMEHEPGLTFAQSQMALYEAMQEEQPGLFNEIRQRIREGRWVVVGGMWSEADMISPSGDPFVRQFLIGKDYARRQLGVEVKVGWLPDSFAGMAGTLPQILKGCGIDYCVLDTRHSPQEVFRWEGPAGSSVIAYPVFVAYNLPPLSPAILPFVRDWGARNPGLRSILVLYGRGDHGGGPRSDDLQGMKALEEHPGAPKMIYQVPQHYYDTEIRPHKDTLPVHTGSLPGMIRLSYSSQARVRMANRAAENLLLTAEMFNTLGTLCQRKPSYPREDFTSAWKLVLRGQFHDALRGTANGRATDDAVADYGQAEREAQALLAQGLQYIGSRIDTSGTGIPLIIYNASSWRRNGTVEVDVRLPEAAADFAVEDASGAEVPYQKSRLGGDPHNVRLLLLARDVPAVGYGTLRIHIGERAIAPTALRASASTLENEYLRVSADDSGAITGILDKRTGRDVLAGTGIQPELLREDPVASSAWNLALTGEHVPLTPVSKAELVESGPVRAVLRSHYRSEDSDITVDAILYAGLTRLEFELRADWHDRDMFLVIGFPIQIKQGYFTVESHADLKRLLRPGSGNVPDAGWICPLRTSA
jgi:alpha-mannosidase